MKNYYKVLDISRNSTNKNIKNKAKELLKKIKESDLESDKKIKLAKKVIESYEFLTDYHSRRKLDNYLDNHLDNQYNIINQNNGNSKSNSFVSIFNSSLDDLFDKSKNNSNNYYFSKTSITKSELDKDGNMISKITEVTNNNGKKEKNEYIKKNTEKINKKNIKPITFIL